MSANLKRFKQAVRDAYERRSGDTAPEVKLWLGTDLIAAIEAALAEEKVSA